MNFSQPRAHLLVKLCTDLYAVRACRCFSVRRTIPKEVMCSGEHLTFCNTSLDSFLNAWKSNLSSFGTTLLVPIASHPPVNLNAFIWHTWSATFVKSYSKTHNSVGLLI